MADARVLQNSLCPVCDTALLTDEEECGTGCAEYRVWCGACGAYQYSWTFADGEARTHGPHLTSGGNGPPYRDEDGKFISSAVFHTRQGNRHERALAEGRMLDRGLVRACAIAPADKAPRLILADWCDDHNLPNWAGFWRNKAAELAESAADPGPVGRRPVD